MTTGQSKETGRVAPDYSGDLTDLLAIGPADVAYQEYLSIYLRKEDREIFDRVNRHLDSELLQSVNTHQAIADFEEYLAAKVPDDFRRLLETRTHLPPNRENVTMLIQELQRWLPKRGRGRPKQPPTVLAMAAADVPRIEKFLDAEQGRRRNPSNRNRAITFAALRWQLQMVEPDVEEWRAPTPFDKLNNFMRRRKKVPSRPHTVDN